MDLTYDRVLRLSDMLDDYKPIKAYMQASQKMDYVQFDYAVVHNLTLFMQDPDFDFEALENSTDYILSVLPAIKRIFAQPLIHLKENDVILPVEAVRVVNSKTINHVASHSELWTDIKDGEIKPEKLLTRTYEDNYGIYENLVFCNVVDEILNFARANIRFLREMIFVNRTIEINLLERVNHLNYFLALGKLHIGYSKSFEAYYEIAGRCLNKLQFIVSGIVPRLKRPVYKNNTHRAGRKNLKIRKTNILSMHKEYHRVYKLAKYFALNNVTAAKEISDKDIAGLQKSYEYFCRALCLFSVGHFNFACDENKAFDLNRPALKFGFKGWTLDFSSAKVGKRNAIVLDIKKDRQYKIVLVPSVVDVPTEEERRAAKADEYIVCSPFGDCDDSTFIDITSLDSFRRFQQIVLRGMICADTERCECPFCTGKLSAVADKTIAGGAVYECKTCRTEIYDSHCAIADKPFVYTKIAGYSPREYDGGWLKERSTEGDMYFRNITEISDGEPVCPHCGVVHK